VQERRPLLAIQRSQLDAEKAALEALNKRIGLAEKRVASLQLRIGGVSKELKERNKTLANECAVARERFASSYQALQVRKRLFAEKMAERKAASTRIKVALDQLEEETMKIEAEIVSTRDTAEEHERNCKEWMEAIAGVVRARRNSKARANRAAANSSSSASQQQQQSNRTPAHQGDASLSIQTFDVVRAFREKQTQGSSSAGDDQAT